MPAVLGHGQRPHLLLDQNLEHFGPALKRRRVPDVKPVTLPRVRVGARRKKHPNGFRMPAQRGRHKGRLEIRPSERAR